VILRIYTIYMINNKRYSGFSLVELMIVLAIVGILLNISYFSYIGHVTRVRRSNAVIALIDLASRLEQYYSDNHSYAEVVMKNMNIKANKFYQLEITSADEGSFLIEAIPIGAQAQKDYKCGTLILDNLGNESVSGVGNIRDCWG
jgi:type IV pilus assembly protein PilE